MPEVSRAVVLSPDALPAPVVPLLSLRQQKILGFIRSYYAADGWAPSVREIAEAVGLTSASSAVYQLERLQDMGWIRRHPNRPRALVVLDPATGGQ